MVYKWGITDGRGESRAAHRAAGDVREPRCFGVIEVTKELHQLIRDLERSVMALEHATDRDEIEDLYGVLAFHRLFLYEYLEDIERMAGVNAPTTFLRFT